MCTNITVSVHEKKQAWSATFKVECWEGVGSAVIELCTSFFVLAVKMPIHIPAQSASFLLSVMLLCCHPQHPPFLNSITPKLFSIA